MQGLRRSDSRRPKPAPAEEGSTQLGQRDTPLLEDARELTRGIVERMGFPSMVSARESEGNLLVTIHTRDSGLLIGRRGATLNALQSLVSLMVNRLHPGRIRVIVDAEGYRSRRRASLEATALHLADCALEEGRAQEVETHSSYERRIVHMALMQRPGVTTESRGKGVDRRLFIVPDNLG